MSWTAPTDVTGAWIGEGAPTDLVLVQTWIDKAEREIRYRIPDIQTRIDAEANGTPPSIDLLSAAQDVVVAMVTRVFRNPDGVRQTNEGVGPFTTSRTYGGNMPGELAMTDAEMARLQGSRDGAFTVSLIPASSPFAGL